MVKNCKYCKQWNTDVFNILFRGRVGICVEDKEDRGWREKCDNFKPLFDYTKNLFVPLKTEFYDKIKSGEKLEEFRLYGSKWNEKTCALGRGITFSKGYGKHERMYGTVTGYSDQTLSSLDDKNEKAILSCYGKIEGYTSIARIKFELKEIGE